MHCRKKKLFYITPFVTYIRTFAWICMRMLESANFTAQFSKQSAYFWRELGWSCKTKIPFSEWEVNLKQVKVHEVYENCDEVKGIMRTSYQTTFTVIKLCMRESYQTLTVVSQLMKLLPEAAAGAPGHSLRYSVYWNTYNEQVTLH